ncbi:hypothetical protein [Sphingobacterium hotanense]|uniref:Uncharacterized protein n=1 Tax=Sphingobacterium hotanense TaxID=649196 RepID=A0ABT7NQ40_9SPHI|nr:hypothetical protein [Sphingobacterium hotanense]MDM1049368.1 hypothetical protein [Sphingobacterium hotanense]
MKSNARPSKPNYLIGILIIAAFGVLTFLCTRKEKDDNSPIVIDWHSPSLEELRLIGPILGGNGITGCGVFKVGTYKGETKVACTRDDVNWIYYDIWEASQAVNRTPTDQYSRFNSPN